MDLTLAWELLYRLEPELYDRLVSAERLHPDVLRWLPDEVERIVEVGAGAGRLTVELIHRAREVVAVEPAAPLRQLLDRKLSRVDPRNRVRVTNGFFDDVPVADDFADLVVACSALTPARAHGGDPGLAEMERVESELEQSGVRCETRVDAGDPADVLVRLAAECGADLLVIGNKGMQRRVLGSVPNTVTHKAACSVLIVKTT